MSAAVAPVLAMDGLFKAFGGVVATRDVSLDIRKGEIHALIGPNGAGTTTLISQLFGALRPDRGRILLHAQDLTGLSPAQRARRGISRSFQITALARSMSVLQNAVLAILAQDGHAFSFWRSIQRDAPLQARAHELLRSVGMHGRAGALVESLSHGEQRLLEFALAMAGDPAIVLLDEPMAGLGHEEGLEMTQHLARLKGKTTIILVEHDMDAVFGLADRVTVLVGGTVLATGTPAEIRANPDVRNAYLGDDL